MLLRGKKMASHGENPRPRPDASLAHPWPGYSLSGCVPAAPDSTSPGTSILETKGPAGTPEETNTRRRVGIVAVASISPSSGSRDPRGCEASLKLPMAWRMTPSGSLIETARVRETVATEYSVSGLLANLNDCLWAGVFTKGWIGVPPPEKRTARTTSQNMTVTTDFHPPFPHSTRITKQSPGKLWR